MTRLLAFDPSSTCTGYAYFIDKQCSDSGFIKVTSKRKGYEWDRDLAVNVSNLLDGYFPDVVLIEDISKFNRITNKYGQSLSTPVRSMKYAKAVGIVAGVCRSESVNIVYQDNEWLRKTEFKGQSDNAQRKRKLFASHLSHRKIEDNDEATAILFGDWYLNKKIWEEAFYKKSNPKTKVVVRPSRKLTVKKKGKKS